MRRTLTIALIAAVVPLMGAVHGPGPAFSMSADAHVPPGEVHHGELVAVFGDVVIEGTVTGEVVVIMGSLHVSGTVDNDVVSVLSRVTLTETARIDGEFVNVGWSVKRAAGSRIDGEIVNVNFMNLIPFAGEDGGWPALLRVLYLIKLAKLAALFVVVLLVAALVPRRVSIVAAAIPARWGWSILVGLLTWALFVIACCVLAITLIGIPLAIALGFVMLITKWLGLAGIFFLAGQTIGRNVLHRDLPHISCVLGGFLAFALLCLIPFLGTILTLGLNVVGIGMVILTRFGAEEPWGRGRAVASPDSEAGISVPPTPPPSPSTPANG